MVKTTDKRMDNLEAALREKHGEDIVVVHLDGDTPIDMPVDEFAELEAQALRDEIFLICIRYVEGWQHED